MPQQQLDESLTQLVGAELVFQHGTPPDAEYTFKHALVQDAAYDTLLRSRRQQLHGRIAATLEWEFPEIVEMQPELLARHCAEAGLIEKAVMFWCKAGQQAIERGAMTEAVAQLRKSLSLISGLPDNAARQEQELNVQITLGRALGAAKGLSAPEPGEAFARARQLCQRLDRPSQLGSILTGEWLHRMVRGELEQGEHDAEEMRHLGDTRGDPQWKCFGSFLSGITCFFFGKFLDGQTYLQNGLAHWDSTFRTSWASPDDPLVQALIHLSRTLACLGYIDQARSLRDEALMEARRLSPYNQVFALCHAWYGDWATQGVQSAPAMLRSAAEVLAISDNQGYPIWVAVGNIMRGWSMSGTNQTGEGLPLLLNGIDGLRAMGCNILIPFLLMTLAEAYGMAGQPEQGLDRLAEASSLIGVTQERWIEAEIHRLRGSLLVDMHQHAGAEENYRQALIVAGRQSAKFWELRAALDLSRLWYDQGKRTEASGLLAPVYGWFTEGFDTPVLQDAKALLDELT
jgi:predicted ATPase